jgi:hypothetical protein
MPSMRLFKFALPVLFAAGVALLAARAWTDRADAASRSLLLEHARHQFSQRAAVARMAPNPEAYRADLRTLLRGWFAEQADIGNRFPLLRGQPAPFVPPPPKVRGGDLREFQELAEKQIGAWREGRVDLLETSYAQGLRIDLLRVTKAAQHLAVDVAVWGAPEESETEEADLGKQLQRVMVPVVFKGLSLRFLDNTGRIVARMEASGEPALRLDVPERLVADAPPGLILARYEPAEFPPGVEQIEWTLGLQVRSASGEARLAQAVWKTKPDQAWAGEAWTDQDKVVVEGEGEARAAAAEAGAPQPQHNAGRTKAKPAIWPVRE